MQGRIRACQIDLTSIGHFVDDLVEDQVHAVVGFESEFDPNEETFSRDDSIDKIFAGEGTIHGVDVHEPVHIGALRSFLED